MAIITSEIIEQHLQTDGRSWVRERHIDQYSKEYFIDYLADIGTNLNTMLASHATQIWNSILEGEIQEFVQKLIDGNLSDPEVIAIKYANKLEVLKACFRWAVRQHAIDALKATVLVNYLKANYTTAQIATALGISTTLVTAIYNRFATLDKDLKPLLVTDATKVTDLG